VTKVIHPPARFRSNFTQVLLEPNSYKEAVSSPHSEDWKNAMKEEMSSHEANKTWELVPRPTKAKVLDNRWVYKVKHNPDASLERLKARLVIKGYEQRQGLDYSKTFAPFCRYESLRLLLAIAAAKQLKMKQFDIKTAFLYGDLTETVYMEQPEGYKQPGPDLVCLLKNSLYGLKQAARSWSKTFCGFLAKYDFQPTASDPCVFIGSVNGEVVYLALYVDDGFIICRRDDGIDLITFSIGINFELKVSEVATFLGIQMQPIVAMSSTEAEYVALAAGAKKPSG
jgi:hypothetical protein